MSVAIPKPISPLSVQAAAAEISALINASPQSPRQDEIESVLERMATHINVVGERIICNRCLASGRSKKPPGKLDFAPVLGSDGNPIAFDADMIVQDLMPMVHMAFVAVGKSKDELTEIVRKMLDVDVEDVVDAIRGFEDATGKLDAMREICDAAHARIMLIAEPMEDERSPQSRRDLALPAFR